MCQGWYDGSGCEVVVRMCQGWYDGSECEVVVGVCQGWYDGSGCQVVVRVWDGIRVCHDGYGGLGCGMVDQGMRLLVILWHGRVWYGTEGVQQWDMMWNGGRGCRTMVMV